MARTACIGTGNVGRAWAVVFARAGHEVALFDSAPGQVDAAMPLIARTLDQLADGGMLTEHPAAVLARMRPAATLAQAVAGAAHVQESVREDPGIKRAVASDIAAHAPADAVIAASTSALPGSSFLTRIPNPGPDLIARIHAAMADRMPVADMPAWQAWRDGRILAARRVQAVADRPTDRPADPPAVRGTDQADGSTRRGIVSRQTRWPGSLRSMPGSIGRSGESRCSISSAASTIRRIGWRTVVRR